MDLQRNLFTFVCKCLQWFSICLQLLSFNFSTVKPKSHNSDMVIEDSHEGESVMGEGKLGVMNVESEEDQLPTRGVMSRPRSAAKTRPVGYGMSGPITNTEVK